MDNNQRDESLVLSRDAYAAQQAQTYRPSKPSVGFGHTLSKSLGIIGYILGGIYIVVSTIARIVLRAAYVILKLVYGFVAMFFGDIFAIFVVVLLIGLVIGAITGNPFYKLYSNIRKEETFMFLTQTNVIRGLSKKQYACLREMCQYSNNLYNVALYN